MPASRRRAKARRGRITSEAVAAYQAGNWGAPHRALRLKPWEANPLDVQAPEDAEIRGPASPWTQSVPQALQLRTELEAAASLELP